MPDKTDPDPETGNNSNNITNSNNTGTMGIRGIILQNVGQLSAMTIICGSFLYLGNDYIRQSKEDRGMFRDELKMLRDGQEKRFEKTETTHGRSMEKMGATIERAVTSMEAATKEIHDASRRISKSAPATGPGGN